jgi:hypothetical protein
MTEDERRNRNPAVEIARATLEAIERDHPKVTAAELRLHRVYVIHSPKHICTLNYMGVRPVMHPVSLDVVEAHHFHGPRANLDVYLVAKPDGSFEDAAGTRLTVRLWTGEDA